MKEEYLWDKSGEPDPQIQELEEILGPLRYQPRPLELPRDVRRRSYVPLLAIAASLLIALLAGGLWLGTRKAEQPEQAKSVPSVFKEETRTPIVAQNTDLPKKPVRKHRTTMNFKKNKEALAAKEQLMLALRLASEKLKLAQRRTQGPSPNQIKNQHKVG